MDVYSVLAIATAATATAQVADLDQDLYEFELAEPPVAGPDVPWKAEQMQQTDSDYTLEL